MHERNFKDTEPSKDISKDLKRRYIIALSFIALIVITGQILIQYALSKQQQYSYIINMAGRQRMLSQKISKLSLLILHDPDKREKSTKELHRVYLEWVTFHKGLYHENPELGLTKENSEEVLRLFRKINPYFTDMSQGTAKLLEFTEKNEPHKFSPQVQKILENEEAFLKGMNRIVYQYQTEAMTKVKVIRRIEITLLGLTLLTLVLEAFFIFRPSVREIHATFQKLKQSRNDLQKVNLELEQRVKDRTEEMNKMNRQLLFKNEELFRNNQDLDTFVYTASHDLKAPINNIEGLIEQLHSEFPDTSEEFIFEMIRQSIDQFKTVIKDLAETGKRHANAENTRILFEDVLSEILFSIKDLIYKSETSIEQDFTQAPEIHFSRKDIRSILYNLISNAIKYCSPERKPVVKVRTEKQKGYILLSVSDNGIGIKDTDKEKIFAMYKRLNTEAAAAKEGTGVGMAIVARIINNSGGKIEIESSPGIGSTFKVFFKT